MKPEMIAGCTMCLDCDDRRQFPQGKVGLLLQVFNQSGGMETWARILIRDVLGRSYSGIYATKSNCTNTSLRVYADTHSRDELLECCDTVLVWGHIPDLDAIVRNFSTKKFLAIHHGSLASNWAEEAFGQALPICHGGIAVNQDVAKRWNVDYLPNPVIDHGVRSLGSRNIGTKNVLWNHRWSAEKRPELLVEIAKLLPSTHKFHVSAPKRTNLPANCVNIGQNPDNVKHLVDADVFLSTANQEAFGYSLAEAALAKVPIVCGPYGIGTEIASRIVDSSNPNVWADAIASVTPSFVESASVWVLAHHGQSAIRSWQTYLEIV